MKKQAFTLVELLVVIGIIGILATISIGTFQGYFAQARNAKIIASIAQYKKSLELYLAQNGEYPLNNKDTPRRYICLGEYPADGDFLEGECASEDYLGEDYMNDATLNQTILDTIGVLPEINYIFNEDNGDRYRGVRFGKDPGDYMADGRKVSYSLLYKLEGVDEDCGLAAYDWSGGATNIVKTPRNSTPDSNGSTFCLHILTQPANDRDPL